MRSCHHSTMYPQCLTRGCCWISKTLYYCNPRLTGSLLYSGSQSFSKVYRKRTLSLASFAVSVMRRSSSCHTCSNALANFSGSPLQQLLILYKDNLVITAMLDIPNFISFSSFCFLYCHYSDIAVFSYNSNTKYQPVTVVLNELECASKE